MQATNPPEDNENKSTTKQAIKMPTLNLHKSRQFKKLMILQHYRFERCDDPLSAYQQQVHKTALVVMRDILKQDWSVLLIERRFLNSRRYHTVYISRTDVVDKLLAALTAYEQALTHQAHESKRVRYDLKSFEKTLFGAIHALHLQGSREDVSFDVIRRPIKGWQTLNEYQSWRENRRLLLNQRIGKLTIREWEAEEVGRMMDGDVTVNFFDGYGEALLGVALDDVLPKDLVTRFQPGAELEGDVEDNEDQGQHNGEDDDKDEGPKDTAAFGESDANESSNESDESDKMSLDSDHQYHKAKPSAQVPQGRRPPIRPLKLRRRRSSWGEASSEANGLEPMLNEAASISYQEVQEPAFTLNLKKSDTVGSVEVENDVRAVESIDSGHEESQDLMVVE